MQWDPEMYLQLQAQELTRQLTQRALEREATQARAAARKRSAPTATARTDRARRGHRPARAGFMAGIAVLARVLHLVH